MYSTPTWRQYESRSSAEHVAQLHLLCAGEAADGELAVEVPQRQAVGDHVEVGVAAELACSCSGSVSAIRWPRLR